MLSQFTRKHKPHSSLNLPTGNRRLLVIPSKPRALLSKLLKNIINKTVHDPHSFARDSDIRMHLFQHLEDVDLIRLNALLRSLLLLVRCTCSGFFREFLPGFWLLLRRCFLGCRSFLLLCRFLLGRLLLCLWCH
ncbi:hypothetical protein HanRHA438_Chr05g0206961 [Helianthus annuus]|nr:hypothetical protein HanRHA438_Chr05g0206961 [Helianthus annuus]